MAIFIGTKSGVKCLHVVTHAGGVYCTSDNTWPFLFMWPSHLSHIRTLMAGAYKTIRKVR